MRGFLANAVIAAGLLVPLSLFGQFRGGARPAFSGFRSTFGGARPAISGFRGPVRSHGFAPRNRPAVNRTWSGNYGPPLNTPPVGGSSLVNPGEASCITNPTYAGSLYCRQYSPSGGSYGVIPVYPYWMPSAGDVTTEAAPPPPAPEAPPPDSQLAEQVGNLAAQVEMLREDQAQRSYRSAATPAAPQPMPPATVLVYRDGHQAEVENYAIVGQTLWVFSDQAARRVSLADLDLAATQSVNARRGIDFVTPGPQ